MNFFSRYRIILWSLIILIVINVSAILSFLIFSRQDKPAEKDCCSQEEQRGRAFRSELGLTEEQALKVDLINNTYRSSAEPIAAEIKQKRALILSELEHENPDTIFLLEVVKKLAELQMEIQQKNIGQYLELKKVCTPEQTLRLSSLYRDLYGCPMQKNSMQNRHKNRHGQGEKDSFGQN